MAININPQFDWRRFAGEAASDIGYGMGRAPTIWGGLAAGVQRSQEQQPYRDASARLQAEDAAKQKAITDQTALRAKYADFFNTRGKPDVAQGIADGMIDPAEAYWAEINPKPADKQSLINTGEGVIYDPNTNEWITQPTGDGSAPPDVDGEGKLRNEYNQLGNTKQFTEQTASYQRVLDSAKNSSPAGDMALIFSYMKMLDPGSAVREQEYANASNAASIPERIRAAYNAAIDGEILTPAMRADFVDRAGQIYQGAAETQQTINDRYSGLAGDYGYGPERIVAPIKKIGILDPEFDVTEFLDPRTGQQWAPIPLTEENAEAEFDALPSGVLFMAPDGSVRRK